MTGRSGLERRVQRLEHATPSQGRWFIIHCLDGEEDSVRIDELCNKIENAHGPLRSARDQIIIIPTCSHNGANISEFTVQYLSA